MCVIFSGKASAAGISNLVVRKDFIKKIGSISNLISGIHRVEKRNLKKKIMMTFFSVTSCAESVRVRKISFQ